MRRRRWRGGSSGGTGTGGVTLARVWPHSWRRRRRVGGGGRADGQQGVHTAAAKPTPERKVEYAETVEEAHLIKPRREVTAVVSIQVMSGRARAVIGAVGGGGAAAAAEEGEARSPTTGVLMGELSEYVQHASTPPKAGPPANAGACRAGGGGRQ